MLHKKNRTILFMKKRQKTSSLRRKRWSMSDFQIEYGELVEYTGTDADVVIPEGVTKIGDGAFSQCTNLVSVIFPKTLKEIGCNAFYNCRELTSVEIPDGVTLIGEYTFYYCGSLTSVYYKGTAEEWGEIEFGNLGTNDITVYYYSETEPTTEGNYWHYDENGKIVEWIFVEK